MAQPIDFKAVRRDADFEIVLAAFDIALEKDGSHPDQWKALCPFHDDTNPSLKVNTAKNIFHCFACEAKGNVLDFVMELENVPVRTAASRVAEICGLSGGEPLRKAKRRKKPSQKIQAPPVATPPPKADTPVLASGSEDGEPYNPPLSFELKLKTDDALKVWLEARGIDYHAQKKFGLGRASKRSKTIGDRLAIPLHDKQGRLIGYCGRYADDNVPDDVRKYVLPKGFRKELELFNLHRVGENPDVLVVFESYFSVMRFARQVPSVSPFGRSISPTQVDLIRAIKPKKIIVIFDGDEPGRQGASQVSGELAQIAWVRKVPMGDGIKPHHLSWDDLRPILANLY